MAQADTERPPVPEWTLGERLAKARRHAGIRTQEEMAHRLGVSAPTVAAWETGRNQPRNQIDVLHRWARECEVPIGWLLGIESHVIPLSGRDRLTTVSDDQLRLAIDLPPSIVLPELEIAAVWRGASHEQDRRAPHMVRKARTPTELPDRATANARPGRGHRRRTA